MKTYSEVEVFTPGELLALKEAKRIVRHFPTRDRQGRWVRCHEVARIVGAVLGLPVQDGHYGMMEHSWLWTAPCVHMGVAPNVLDCYVPGRAPAVQLVASATGWGYRSASAKRRDVRPSVMEELYQRLKGRG